MRTLKAKGRLHFLGATLEPIQISVFSMMDSQRSISSSPVGAPTTIAHMLEFADRHNIEPEVEVFDFNDINNAIDRLENGSPRYRVVLKNM